MNKGIDYEKERIGERHILSTGEEVEIMEYNGHKNVKINIVNSENAFFATYGNIIKKSVKNPYFKSVFNVGYFGVGEYKVDTYSKCYTTWSSMLRRCYTDVSVGNTSTYLDKVVDEEWHNFQNYAKWFYENYYEIEGETMALEKDILFKGNKIYSKDTCVFVPKLINGIFLKRQNFRGDYLIGVTISGDKFKARCVDSIEKKRIDLGVFTTEMDAFLAYKEYKEKYIKRVADLYKDKIPQNLYDALYKYEVEITD